MMGWVRRMHRVIFAGMMAFLFLPGLQAQQKVSYGKLKKAAKELFYFYRNYDKAVQYYLRMDQMKNGKKWKVRYMIAKCYIFSNDYSSKKKALRYLLDEKVQKKAGKKRKYRTEYWRLLGQAYHYNYQFEKAISSYERALQYARSKRDKEQIELLKAQAETGKQLIQDSLPVRVENLGEAINSPYMEYAPVVTPDEHVLMFTSRRPGNLGGLMTPQGEPDTFGGTYFEDIYVSIKIGDQWTPAQNVGVPVNSTSHDATVSISQTGDTLYMYRDDSVRWGDVLMTFVNEMGQWVEPQKLPAPINSEAWEGHVTFSLDGSIAIFSSNRAGGYGGKDLWMVRRLPDGSWGEPINLGPLVNTPYDEDGPFLHPDGKTLYFSSNGPRSMGGYDIFVTRYENGKWTEPVNLGHPVNTPADEIYITLSPDGRRLYLSSSREGGLGQNDIYVFHLPYRKEISPEIVLILHAFVKDAETGAFISGARLQVFAGDSLVGVYTPDPEQQYAVMIVTAPDTLRVKVEAEGYLPLDTPLIVRVDEKSPARREFALRKQPTRPWWELVNEQLPVVYFDFDRYNLKDSEKPKIQQIASVLKEKSDLKVWVIGHCDAKGSLGYNVRLGERRARTVYQALVKEGISRERMKILTLGEVLPARVNFTPDGKDHPDHRAMNRRVEVRVFLSDTQYARYNPRKWVPVRPFQELVQEVKKNGKTLFTVYVGSATRALPRDYFHGMQVVYEKREGGKILYYSGKFQTMEEAKKHEQFLRSLGISGARVEPIGMPEVPRPTPGKKPVL